MSCCYFVLFLYVVYMVVTEWILFKKLGFKGWYSIIPGYNWYLLLKRLYGNGWLIFMILIPGYNIACLIMAVNRLSYKFGRKFGFTLGLIFLEPFFLGYLAYSKLQAVDVAENPENKDVELISCIVGDIQKYVERHKSQA